MIDNYTQETQDSLLQEIITVSNIVGLLLSWISIITGLIYFAVTLKVIQSILIAGFAPFRYFFFDIKPSKIQKRPASLDRSVAITIYIKYLSISYPIPNGNFLASLLGFFLAVGRAYINGYGLLWFDTFTFLYKVHDNVNTSIETSITGLEDNDRLKKMEENATDKAELEKLKKLEQGWLNVRAREVNERWEFPIKRYVYTPNLYFENLEIGTRKIDDKYQLDIIAYNKAHPNAPIDFKAKVKIN